ncbi:MAG: alpha/beta hydrolase [Pseudomonadota bacterium]
MWSYVRKCKDAQAITWAIIMLPALLAACSGVSTPRIDEREFYVRAGESCRLFVQEAGHGDGTLIALHGGFGAEYSYLLDAFKNIRGHRIVFYDQRGSLRSPCPINTISIDQHVEDLETLRRSLDLSRLRLVAHSMGTLIAYHYLEKYPQHVGSLVLIGPMPYRSEVGLSFLDNLNPEEIFDDPLVVKELTKVIGQIPQGPDSDKAHSRRQQIEFAAANLYHVDRWQELVGGMAFYNASAGRAAVISVRSQWDFTRHLQVASARGTVHFILGDHDYLDLEAVWHRKAVSDLPDATITVITKAGHTPWIDQPQIFAKALNKALGATNPR